MRLQLGDFGIVERLEAASVEVVFLEPAAQLLESTAADAEDGKGCGDRVVVSKVSLWVEVGFILLGRVLLIEPV
jgi:hypothetical protein